MITHRLRIAIFATLLLSGCSTELELREKTHPVAGQQREQQESEPMPTFTYRP